MGESDGDYEELGTNVLTVGNTESGETATTNEKGAMALWSGLDSILARSKDETQRLLDADEKGKREELERRQGIERVLRRLVGNRELLDALRARKVTAYLASDLKYDGATHDLYLNSDGTIGYISPGVVGNPEKSELVKYSFRLEKLQPSSISQFGDSLRENGANLNDGMAFLLVGKDGFRKGGAPNFLAHLYGTVLGGVDGNQILTRVVEKLDNIMEKSEY